jgi:hypothetical protein
MGKKKTKKQAGKTILSEVIKEMAKPRVAMSARERIPEWRSATETRPIQECLRGDKSQFHRGAKNQGKILETVAVILERERNSVIEEWLRRANSVPALTAIPLSDAERTQHLPSVFDDLIRRLRNLDQNARARICHARTHGKMRFAQGYSVDMLVEESRIFEVSTFMTLHLHQNELIQSQALLDVMTIADEADNQLKEAVQSFIAAGAAAS